MQYQFYTPKKLKGLVNSIWEQKLEEPSRWIILPSGWVELIFNLKDAAQGLQGKLVGDSFNPTKNFSFLSGLHTKPLIMSLTNFHAIGIQMHPVAVKAIFGIPANKVLDWALSGEHFLQELPIIENALLEKKNFFDKATWLESYLQNRMKESGELKMALKIVKVIQDASSYKQSGQSVDITSLTGYSRMHTNRIFKEWFGDYPSRTLRLNQFVNSVQGIHNTATTLTDVGYINGYYDQSHFIRIFKEFSDMTPNEYRKKMSPIPGHFSL